MDMSVECWLLKKGRQVCMASSSSSSSKFIIKQSKAHLQKSCVRVIMYIVGKKTKISLRE
jgi:hypothetical protein